MKSLCTLAFAALALVTIGSSRSEAVTLTTESDYTDNFVQTYGESLIWNSAGYVRAPGNSSVLYSVGSDPERSAYGNADYLAEAVSITFSFTSLNGRSLSLYTRVDATTHTGIAGYFGLVDGADGAQLRFRLYNSANPDTYAVGSQVGSDTIITLASGVTPISTSDILTLKLQASTLDNQTFILTLSRENEELAYFERKLTTAVDTPGAVGFRAFSEMRIYEFSIIPEPSVVTLALGGGVALLSGFAVKRRMRKH